MADVFLVHEGDTLDEALADDADTGHILFIPQGADVRYVCRSCSATLRKGDYLHIADLASVVATAEDLLLFLQHITESGVYLVSRKEDFWLAPTPDDIRQAIFDTLRAVIALEKKTPLLSGRETQTTHRDAPAASGIFS